MLTLSICPDSSLTAKAGLQPPPLFLFFWKIIKAFFLHLAHPSYHFWAVLSSLLCKADFLFGLFRHRLMVSLWHDVVAELSIKTTQDVHVCLFSFLQQGWHTLFKDVKREVLRPILNPSGLELLVFVLAFVEGVGMFAPPLPAVLRTSHVDECRDSVQDAIDPTNHRFWQGGLSSLLYILRNRDNELGQASVAKQERSADVV